MFWSRRGAPAALWAALPASLTLPRAPSPPYAQVVVAVDDTRSMAETGCGGFALEALALICRSMARLEVGELGVVSFGGAGGAAPLHPLERPFTDADGPRVMGALRFDADNTLADRPMVDVITSLGECGGGGVNACGRARHPCRC